MIGATRRRLLLSAACAALALPALRRSDAAPLHTTLHRRHVVGYQGWFICPDEQNRDDWFHWFHRMQDGRLQPTFDMLPDTSEFEEGEGCPTPWTDRGGRPVRLFTAQDARSVRRHFRWMREYEIDGAAMQRFVSVLANARRRAQLDRTLANVRAAAEAEGRSMFLMYDLSGTDDSGLRVLIEDWRQQVEAGQLRSPAQQFHGGRPVLGLWGLGFRDRPLTPDAVLDTIAALRRIAGSGGLTIVAGVPAFWRTGTRDADPSPRWQEVYAAVQVLSPWTVGRYADAAGADTYLRQVLRPDMAQAAASGKEMLPVIFPGFSWANVMRARQREARLNQIARRCGAFYWHQAANAVNAGAGMLYTAMFDEVDEGTAIFKLVPDLSGQPADSAFLPLDVDGCALPADWYLQLARGVTRGLREGRLAVRPEL
ncbi:glycoside hydrolase family 71/99-like protein [Falsiroseomonas bella]|uniref:glycoside hydrolase family 71/99-like protein n=1 Tax=Falsiroseomonas bella TaxID=2184016 RepID=UPI001304BC72|nr:glycoside hydrolase family 71/99-like protein [Falsiroseomonas bella]